MSSLPYEDRPSSSGAFLTGMMWGIAVGAVAALFLAPRRGAELREQVAGSVNRAGRRAVDTYNRASERMTGIAGRAADLAGNLTDRAATLTAKLNQTITDRRSSSIS